MTGTTVATDSPTVAHSGRRRRTGADGDRRARTARTATIQLAVGDPPGALAGPRPSGTGTDSEVRYGPIRAGTADRVPE